VRAGAPLHVLAEQTDQPPGERLQDPGDKQDDDDAPGAYQREAGLVVQAVNVLEEILN
jgi:hypothetical protein